MNLKFHKLENKKSAIFPPKNSQLSVLQGGQDRKNVEFQGRTRWIILLKIELIIIPIIKRYIKNYSLKRKIRVHSSKKASVKEGYKKCHLKEEGLAPLKEIECKQSYCNTTITVRSNLQKKTSDICPVFLSLSLSGG